MGRIEDQPFTAVGGDPAIGRLTVGWQLMIGVTWVAAFFAFAAVWKASEEVGIGTWWLGPRAQKQPMPIRVIPFTLCVLVIVAAMYNVRRLSAISLLGSMAVAAIAAGDVSRSGGLAAIEFAIAIAILLVSAASLTGVRRADPSSRRPVEFAPGDSLPPPHFPPPVPPA